LHKELDDRLFKELMDNPYTANKVELQQEKVKKDAHWAKQKDIYLDRSVEVQKEKELVSKDKGKWFGLF